MKPRERLRLSAERRIDPTRPALWNSSIAKCCWSGVLIEANNWSHVPGHFQITGARHAAAKPSGIDVDRAFPISGAAGDFLLNEGRCKRRLQSE